MRRRALSRTAIALAISAGASAASATISYVESSSGLSTPPLEAGLTEIEIADLDGDGNLDLVSLGDHGNPGIGSGESGVLVWFGNGAGSWSHFQTGDFGYGGIAVGDLNGDGLADIAYGMHHDWSSTDFGDQLVEAALGDGTGRAWTPWDDGLATAGETYGMFGTDLADVDNDGDLDLGVLSFGAGNGFRVYLNHGDGTWTPSFSRTGDNSRSNDIVFGDVDADGNPDLAIGYENGTVWLGDGAGGFALADGNLPGTGFFSRRGLDLGDVDGDGRDDVSFVNGSGGVEVWLWRGSATWESASAGLPSSGGFRATQLRDFDGDGGLDVAAMGSGTVTVWLGNGGASWAQATSFPVGDPGNFSAFRAGGDADRNGLPDLAVVADEREGLFSTRNHLRFFREASVPQALAIRPVRPRGGEVFPEGGARFLRWASAVPGGAASRVRIELSTTGPSGPWSLVADDLPDDGRFQWTVPPGTATANAFLRYTVTTAAPASATATTAAPFSIVVSDADGDGVPNWQDCAPGDGGAFARPGETSGLRVARAPVDPEGSVAVSWDDPAASSGAGTTNDLLVGPVSGLGPDGSLGGATCAGEDLPGTGATIPLPAAPGEAWWILLRPANVCGSGSWGFASGGAERDSGACSP